MKYTGLVLLFFVSLGFTSCSSDGGPSGGLIGLLTGGIIGHIADQNISNPYLNNGGTTTTTTTGTTGTVAGTTGTILNANGTVAGTTTVPGTTTVVTNGTTTGSTSLYDNKGLLSGAVGGLASGVITDQFREGEIKRKYDEGYAKGKSDSIKELYFLKQKAQKRGNEEDPPVQYRYYEVEVPAHTTSDGVFIDRHTRVIEVVE